MLLTIVVLAMQSGCYWNTPILDLISPPKLTNEQIEIYNALISSTGSGITLKYPKTGDYLSAFVFLENGGVVDPERVMVFYELPGAANVIQLDFLEKRGGRWATAYTFPFPVTGDIEKIEFARLGGERENVIVSSSAFNQPERSLRVFSYIDGVPAEVYQRDLCVYYEVFDFDDSGVNTLLSINKTTGEVSESTAEFARWADDNPDSLSVVYKVSANPGAISYIHSIKSALPATEVSPEQARRGLFLEYSQSDSVFNSGVIVFDGEQSPRNVVYTANESQRNDRIQALEKRPNPVTAYAYARDVNGDGYVDVAGNQLFPGYDSAVPSNERVRAAVWYEIGGTNVLNRIYSSFLGLNNDFVFSIPTHWEDTSRITATIVDIPDSGGYEVVFWRFPLAFENIYDLLESDANGEADDLRLLSIVTLPKGARFGDYRAEAQEYEIRDFASNPDYNYFIRVYNNSISKRGVSSNFRVLPP